MPLQHAKKMMTARLVDSLYTEAMVMADEARSYFDEIGRGDRDLLSPVERVAFSCESLKVTTRLMHVIAWLLTRKAIAAGEIREDDPGADLRRLGADAESDQAVIDALPPPAQAIIRSSMDLYGRVARIDRGLIEPEPESPALGLLRRIEQAL
jgi:regulator of CtrA degradation